ncbi:MAG TPA: PD-(D/E)XK nuclease family protein, partial [Anaeromyxobacteraceae bacterium]|nr:PD-(D/E)XK nuclease family protein [Anaeromyxobacteraceae bacterium]
MQLVVVDSLAAWADAVAALPAAGPLPSRTVLVPSERHAHALRRALVRSGRAAILGGARFLGPLAAAAEVLRSAGTPFQPGEGALRPARLLSLFREDLPLAHFDLDLLRTARGWHAAFASAIADLEAAGLGPDDLPADIPALRDLALLWRRGAEEAGASWSAARVLREAAALLSRDARAWPFAGPALAVATGHETAALARFVTSIPSLTLALRTARPITERHAARVAALFGAEAALRLRAACRAPIAGAAPAPRSERDLLAAGLLADPAALAGPDRPRSAGPDGTVALEEHAGVDAELEATALWVTRQVLEARRPLDEIAVLVPSQDPLAQLVADRLERLLVEGRPLAVHVAGGVPATSTAAGARMLAAVRALR